MTGARAYADLAGRMSTACSEAVDPYELAAVLEADGITDVTARQRYAARDVFDLADRMFRQSPRLPQPNRPAADPWRAIPVTHVLRGVLFGLPALAFLTVADRLTGPRPAVLLVVSVLLSWAVGQGMAYLGYLGLGAGDRRAAAAALGGAGLLGALPAVTVVVVVGLALGVPLVVTLIAAGQVAYVLAATVSLVLGREWWLLAALAPGVGAGTAELVGWPVADRSGVLAAGAALSVVAATAAAGWHLRGVRPRLPGRDELAGALPNVAFGALVGAFLVFTAAVRALSPDPDPRAGVAAALAVVLPLSVSMGAAEWLLFRYRSATRRAMAGARNLRAFGRQASAALLRVTTGYLAVLLGLFHVGTALALLLTGEAPRIWPVVAAVLTGPALFVALLLMSFDIRGPVVGACLAALAVSLALLPLAPPETIQAVTAAGLLTGLYAYASRTLRRAQLHL